MASGGIYDNPPTWIPYITNRDCSQGICSLNCPQFCYFALPPPPPVDFAGEEVNSNSPFNFSPLVIAIIGILASAVLLVSYYTLISKYCRSSRSSPPPRGVSTVSGGLSGRERWFGPNSGLEEAVIQSIAVVKYKKGSFGSIEATCSVCLSEFEEGESVRLLPKCHHPFHVPCIDTWLKSHPSCPLCRSDIVFPMVPPPEKILTPPSTSSSSPAASETVDSDSAERNNDDVIIRSNNDVIIDVVEERNLRAIRRSFSTGHWCHQTVADVMSEEYDDDVADRPVDSKTGKDLSEILCNDGHRGIRVSGSEKCGMKRSFSSGRLTISRLRRAKERVLGN